MSQLWVRLSLALIALTTIAIAAVAWLADRSAGVEFRQYLSRQELLSHPDLLQDLSSHFERQGGWDGVAELMSDRAALSLGASNGPGGYADLLLADQNGLILYDERGRRTGHSLTAQERWNALSVMQGDRIVGFVYAAPPDKSAVAPAALEFLNEFQNTLAVAVIAVGALGVATALLISRTLASPLRTLAAAARGLAAHQWNRRVSVRGTDEIAAVARAFNEMADELQRSETQQRNFMADIAHELRTPLTVLQGSLRAMLDHVYRVEEGEIAKLYDQTRLLVRLVDDLRDLAQAESPSPSLKLDRVDLAPILDRVASELATVAEARDVQLDLRRCELPVVCADPDRLMQILLNLLSNALRHSAPHSRVEICAEKLIPILPETQAGSEYVRITVSDQGEGIPKADLPHVFDRFYRVDKSRSRDSGGIGLGLAIARAWVQAMGGEIGATSSPGQGSSFWFTLPATCAKT